MPGPVRIGSRIAHYEVVGELGAGGMGEVYRAADGKLGREVALKVLPQAFVRDAERMARFEREARLLAALNHPGIGAIYGIEERDGVRCLVLELVEGPTLAERLARGPLPVEEAVAIALGIAAALEAAHERGIVHRDLKPANVKLPPAGGVKVLDFGLAKAAEPEGAAADPDDSPTLTAGAGATMAGVVLGTAAYMSPEQAAGKPVDRRTDIWSFGAVLYEMLAGRRLVAGDTATEILAGVIAREPDLDALPPLPRPLAELLGRCLRKDPRSRLRDIGDARIVLEELAAGAELLPEPAAALVPVASSSRWPWLVAAALLAALAAGAAWLAKPAPPPPPLVTFEIPVAEATAQRIRPALSPDGESLVYGSGGRLWLRRLGALEALELPGTAGAESPFFSPDGGALAFSRGNRLWRMALPGGEPAPVTALERGFGSGAGGVWTGDGEIVFTSGTSGLARVPAQGGDTALFVEVGEGEVDFHEVSALPGGRGFLFVVHAGDGTFGSIALAGGGGRRTVLELPGERLSEPVYAESGHLLFGRRGETGGVWAAPFSLGRLEVTGEPVLLVPGAARFTAAGGHLAYVPVAPGRPMELVIFDRAGAEERVVATGNAGAFPSFSPDGRRVAVSEQDGEDWHVWVHDLERGTRQRVTFASGVHTGPRWTPDGSRLFFFAGPDRSVIAAADGSADPEPLADAGCWRMSGDGRYLICTRGMAGGEILYRELDGNGELRPFFSGPAADIAPDFSPDGRYVVYQSNDSGRDEIYVRPFPAGEGRWQVSTDGGTWPRWSPAGDEIFYVRGADVLAAGVETEPKLALGTPRLLFTRPPSPGVGANNWPDGFDVSPDGRRFVTRRPVGEPAVERRVAVVLNWRRLLD